MGIVWVIFDGMIGISSTLLLPVTFQILFRVLLGVLLTVSLRVSSKIILTVSISIFTGIVLVLMTGSALQLVCKNDQELSAAIKFQR